MLFPAVKGAGVLQIYDNPYLIRLPGALAEKNLPGDVFVAENAIKCVSAMPFDLHSWREG